MTIGSLFSGIGGLELGLELAGLGPTLFQVEREPFCREVLAKHWPASLRLDDVCAVGAHNLPAVDLLCGGFPCQDLSLAGKGAGLAGARSGLWFEYARIIGELRPRFVVVENVAALVNRGLHAVLGSLAALGYDAWWDCIPAAAVGAPHRRDRLFVVAWRAVANPRELIGQQQQGRAGGTGRALSPLAYGHGADGVVDDEGPAGALAHADSLRGLQPQGGIGEQRRRIGDSSQDMGNPHGPRLERRSLPVGERADEWTARQAGSAGGGDRESVAGMGRATDGLPRWLDGHWPARPGEAQAPWEAPRTAVLKRWQKRPARLRALGNAVSPAVGYVIGCVVRGLVASRGVA